MATIHITQRENDKYFNQKLPTFRNGFCKIERKVIILPDPFDVYDHYGEIKTPHGKVFVRSVDGAEWEIE